MENNLEFKLLGKSFEGKGSQRGWFFREEKRVGDVAMYEKVDSESKCVYYEVIRVRKDKGGKFVLGGKMIEVEAQEVYPNDKKFGSDGWCYGSLVEANKRFDVLCQVVNKG